jgi:hypothetical protein
VTVEAASPVLIEKVRTTISDSSGRYQIVDLRPGSYTVTFTLPGFNTVKRDRRHRGGSGNVAVDADLRVGALEETVTVTGEAPVVDTQSITQQRVLNSEMVDALPSARNYFGLARMIPGTLGGGNDVGGSLIQDVGQSVIVHGSRNVDQRVTVNGVSTMTLQAGGNIGGQTPDVGSASEVTVDTNSLSADLPTGGVRINFVPKDGGNRFSNSTFLTFANESLQGDNFSDELRAAGLGTPNKLVNAFDINESIGGPFKQNKVWFWFSARYNTTENEAPVFANKYAYDPGQLLTATSPTRRSRREQGHAGQQQPARHLAGEPAQQDRRHLQGRQVVQLSEQHQRHACRPRPAATAASRACGRSTASGRRRSTTTSCSRPWGCTCSSAGATCTTACTTARSTIPPSKRCCRSSTPSWSREAVRRPELRHPVELQQHRGAELDVSRGDVVRDRIARVQVRLQPHARLSGREPVHAQPGGLRASTTACRTWSPSAPTYRVKTNLDNDLGFYAQDRWTVDR